MAEKNRGFSFDRLFGKIDIRYFLRDAIHHGVRHDEPYVIAQRKNVCIFPQKIQEIQGVP